MSRSLRCSAHAHRFARTPVSELPLLFTDWLDLSQATAKRNRIFTPTRTFWMFLAQILSADGSCTEALSRSLVWLALEGCDASADTSAYCKARQRLDDELIQQACSSVAQRLEREANSAVWYGRPVKVVDGTTVSMPDTPQNQKVFPQPFGQKPGCGFPVMRIVALFSLASGALLAHAEGNLSVGETTLWRQLWEKLSPGDVVLADRNFSGYAYLGLLLGQGVDSVVRMNAARSAGSRVLERLGPGDFLVEWDKTGNCPDWLTPEQWNDLPPTLTLRMIQFKVDVPGFRTEAITVVTTIFDKKRYPKKAFVELYERRWRVELFFRDLKTTMRMDVLRTKTPQMIRKEMLMHLLAYNMIRALMWQAGVCYDVNAGQISFKRSLDMVRTWATALMLMEDEQRRDDMGEKLLRYISRCIIRPRPNRSEPRAKKRRPKNYQLLNKARSEFKEITHRNRYTKPAEEA